MDEEIPDFELEIKFIGFQYLLNMFLIELELPVLEYESLINDGAQPLFLKP